MKQPQSGFGLMGAALRHLADSYDMIEAARQGDFTLPALQVSKPNGANGHSVKALPAPQKVRQAVKALPAAPTEAPSTALAKPEKPVKAKKVAKKVKAKAAAKAPKAPKPAKVKAAKAAKPAKAAKAPKAPKPAKAKSDNAISEGRRAVAEGLRPKLVDAVAIVMGKETLTAGVILARLQERGWEPGASNPQSYISYTLSDNEEVFKRGKRGEYSVIDPKKFAAVAKEFEGKSKGGKTSKKAERVASTDAGEAEVAASSSEPEVQAAPAEVVAEAAPVAGDPPNPEPSATTAATDQALEDLGVGATSIGANPFDALN